MVQLGLNPILSTNWESSAYGIMMGTFTGTPLSAAINSAIFLHGFNILVLYTSSIQVSQKGKNSDKRFIKNNQWQN